MTITIEEIEKERKYRIRNYKEFLKPVVLDFIDALNCNDPLDVRIEDIEYNCSFNPYCMDHDLLHTYVYINSSNIVNTEEFIINTLWTNEDERLEAFLKTIKEKGYELEHLIKFDSYTDNGTYAEVKLNPIPEPLKQYEDYIKELHTEVEKKYDSWLDDIEFEFYDQLAYNFNYMTSDEAIIEDLEARKELQGEE